MDEIFKNFTEYAAISQKEQLELETEGSTDRIDYEQNPMATCSTVQIHQMPTSKNSKASSIGGQE